MEPNNFNPQPSFGPNPNPNFNPNPSPAPEPQPAPMPIPQPIQEQPIAPQPIQEQPAQEPQPAPATASSTPKPKRSFGAILPILLLFIIAVGMGIFAFLEMKRANKADTEAADLRNQLANVKPECEQKTELKKSDIKEAVENFYKLRRKSQKGTSEDVLDFINLNGYKSSNIDEETNEIISEADFANVRNAMRKYGTDNLANDYDLYKGLRNVDGKLRYKATNETETATITYTDTIEDEEDIKLVKADNLHYEISITTKTYTSGNLSTPESSNVRHIDAYFIVDKDDRCILNQVVEN
jgi:copper chaperone CopZ